MKNLNLRGAVVLLAVVALIVVAGSAQKVKADSPHGDSSGFCSDNDNFGRTHGECVSIAEAAAHATAGLGNADGVEICKLLEQIFGPFPLGQCISHYTKF